MKIKKEKSNRVFPDLSLVPKIDKVGVEERVARFQSRSLKDESKLQGLMMA